MLSNLFDYMRFALYGLLVVIILILFQQWKIEHPAAVQTTPQSDVKVNNYIPQVATNKTETHAETTPLPPKREGENIHVSTNLISVDIDTNGGNITNLKLLNYPEELHSTQPVVLLNDDPITRYIAQSGLLGTKGPDTSSGQAIYKADQQSYALSENQTAKDISLVWEKEGVRVTKIYHFKQDSYEIGLTYQIENHSQQDWTGNLYLQLLRTNTPPTSKNGLVSLATYFGAAISSPEKQYEKISFKKMSQQNINQAIQGGWAAMIQHYFVSAWVPNNQSLNQYYTRVTPDQLYTVGMLGPSIVVKPGATFSQQAKLYSGPNIAKNLEKVAPGLQLTIDYGIFWFISVALFWLMQKIYYVVGNWGWSIVLVTVIIKLLFYKLSAKSYRSMSGLKKLHPKIELLKERYGSDKQKLTQAMLELYKKEKVNPMGGCLPILIQIPVFIALYWVLVESVELRQSPFILWIHDLSVKDPYYILPLLMGLSMFLQQRLNPPPPDPMQAKIMLFMPIVFTALFLNFPAGLMLYWFVNNMLSFVQQWFIMKQTQK